MRVNHAHIIHLEEVFETPKVKGDHRMAGCKPDDFPTTTVQKHPHRFPTVWSIGYEMHVGLWQQCSKGNEKS